MEPSHRHGHHRLYRCLRCARAETPEGSQPTGVGDASIPLCCVTKPPALAPSSCPRSPLSLSHDALAFTGGLRADHVPSVYQHGGGGLTSPPVGHHLRPVPLAHRCLTPYLVVQASSHLPLVSPHDGYRSCTSVDLPMLSSLPTPLRLGVATSARACVTILTDAAPWSQPLHTPPLPVTHVLGGDWWQNTR